MVSIKFSAPKHHFAAHHLLIVPFTALNIPLFLLPFRPKSDTCTEAQDLVGKFFSRGYDTGGHELNQHLRLLKTVVSSSRQLPHSQILTKEELGQCGQVVLEQITRRCSNLESL